MTRIDTDETYTYHPDRTVTIETVQRIVSDEEIENEAANSRVRQAITALQAAIDKGKANWTAADVRDAAFLHSLILRALIRKFFRE